LKGGVLNGKEEGKEKSGAQGQEGGAQGQEVGKASPINFSPALILPIVDDACGRSVK
jgi:hypothetical protein